MWSLDVTGAKAVACVLTMRVQEAPALTLTQTIVKLHCKEAMSAGMPGRVLPLILRN